jgi:hypothetical protein
MTVGLRRWPAGRGILQRWRRMKRTRCDSCGHGARAGEANSATKPAMTSTRRSAFWSAPNRNTDRVFDWFAPQAKHGAAGSPALTQRRFRFAGDERCAAGGSCLWRNVDRLLLVR